MKEHCSLYSVNEPKELEGFHCGDIDIDEFFANDCFGFTKQLLGKTYCYRLNQEPDKVVCAFTLANHIGSDVLDFIKIWFIEPLNKTGCRFVIVDAYNTPKTMAFYEQNGFITVFSTEQQEKDYRHITSETSLNTRLMFYDLMQTIEEYR